MLRSFIRADVFLLAARIVEPCNREVAIGPLKCCRLRIASSVMMIVFPGRSFSARARIVELCNREVAIRPLKCCRLKIASSEMDAWSFVLHDVCAV
jgi:hypothetical protein